jgi:hypothetical protein
VRARFRAVVALPRSARKSKNMNAEITPGDSKIIMFL